MMTAAKYYPEYRISCPEFFLFTGDDGKPQKTSLSVYLAYDSEEETLIFETTSINNNGGVLKSNCVLRLEEVYVAAVALAKRLGWIRTPNFNGLTPDKWSRKIKGREVAHVDSKYKDMIDSADLTKEEIREISRYMSPEKDTHAYWSRLQNVKIERVEDSIELSEEDKKELCSRAREFLKTQTPHWNGSQVKYQVNLEEAYFAPNAFWTAWAIREAHRGDPNYERTTYNVVYDGKHQIISMDVTWLDRAKLAAEPPKMRSNYFSNVRKSKRHSDG